MRSSTCRRSWSPPRSAFAGYLLPTWDELGALWRPPASAPGYAVAEVTVAEPAMSWTTADVEEAVVAFLALATR